MVGGGCGDRIWVCGVVAFLSSFPFSFFFPFILSLFLFSFLFSFSPLPYTLSSSFVLLMLPFHSPFSFPFSLSPLLSPLAFLLFPFPISPLIAFPIINFTVSPLLFSFPFTLSFSFPHSFNPFPIYLAPRSFLLGFSKKVPQEYLAASTVMPVVRFTCCERLSKLPTDLLLQGRSSCQFGELFRKHKLVFTGPVWVAGHVAPLNKCRIANSSKLQVTMLSKPTYM